MRVTLPAAKYRDLDRWTAFHEDLVSARRSIPGVDGRRHQQRRAARRRRIGIGRRRRRTAAAAAGHAGRHLPLSGEQSGLFSRDGHPARARAGLHRARYQGIATRRDRRRIAGAEVVPGRGSAGPAHRVRVQGRSAEPEIRSGGRSSASWRTCATTASPPSRRSSRSTRPSSSCRSGSSSGVRPWRSSRARRFRRKR